MGGGYQGYRYATRTEFSNLISGFTGIDYAWFGPNGKHNVPSGTLTIITNLLGPTKTFGLSGILMSDPPHTQINQSYDMLGTTYIKLELSSSRSGRGPVEYSYFASSSSIRYGFEDHHSSEPGSFLVRDTLNPTPTPAAGFIFAPVLLGFSGLRRRSKQA